MKVRMKTKMKSRACFNFVVVPCIFSSALRMPNVLS